MVRVHGRRSLLLAAELETVELDAHPYLIRVYGVTEEEYARITDEDTKYELLDGVLIMHSPASIPHEVIVDTLEAGGYTSSRIPSGRLSSTAIPGFWLDASWLWQDPLPAPLPLLLQILG